MSFAQGFQSGLNNMIQIYDMKSRRDARKKQEERDDTLWDRQTEEYEYNKNKRLKEDRNQSFKDKVYVSEALGSLFNGDSNIIKDPELTNSINRLFGPEISQGYGKNKKLDGQFPAPDGSGLMFSVGYDDPETGERKSRKPITVGRTNDPNDPVSIVSADELINIQQRLISEIKSADIPEEEKKKHIQRVREAIHRRAGDNSLYEARIAQEKLQEERGYESKIAARDLANDRETDRIKHGYALDLQRAKQKGEGGISSGSFNGVNYPVSQHYRLNATIDDINSSLNLLYKVSPDNVMNFTEENIKKSRFAKKLGSSWEKQFPDLLDVGTISDLAYQASINIIPDEKELMQQAKEKWPDVTPEQSGGKSKNDWIDSEVERLKGEASKKAEDMFYKMASEVAQQRLAGQQPVRGLGRQTPQPDSGGFQPLPPVETQPVGWMQDQQPAPQPEPAVQQPAQQQTESTPELQAQASSFLDALEAKRAQPQPEPTPEPATPQPQVPQNVVPSGVQDSVRAKLAMGEMMQQPPVKQLGRGQPMPPASIPQSFEPRGIGGRGKQQPQQSDQVIQSFVQAVANGAPVEQITQNMVNLGVPEEQIAQVIQEGEQVKQANAVQSVIQSVLQGGDIRIAQQALKQIGLDENTINKTINQALTLKKQQMTQGIR